MNFKWELLCALTPAATSVVSSGIVGNELNWGTRRLICGTSGHTDDSISMYLSFNFFRGAV